MAFNTVKLDGEKLKRLISELAELLPDDFNFQLVLCGGSVLAMYHPELGYCETTDADIFDYFGAEIPSSLTEYIKKVAKNNSLGEDWMNDAVMRTPKNHESELTKSEYINFIENYDSPEYFYNTNDVPVIVMYRLSLLGLIASKSLANRAKDISALKTVLAKSKYNNMQELEDDFNRYALSFVNSSKYKKVLAFVKGVMQKEWNIQDD